jgi:hypothetical protein
VGIVFVGLLRTKTGSRVSGCEVLKEARDPVGIASRRIEARGGFEGHRADHRASVRPLDRLRVTIGDLDRQFAGYRQTSYFDGGDPVRQCAFRVDARPRYTAYDKLLKTTLSDLIA